MPAPTNARTKARGSRTIQESARLLGVGYAAVNTMMDTGELPFVKAGNRRQPTVAGLEAKLGMSVEQLEAKAAEEV